jgi:ActR/RegA family two-component response regulator
VTSILIVEDDEQFRAAVARDLSHRGFDVSTVESVADALSRLHQRVFDVLLTDLRLGERDGIDLLGQLTVAAPDTRTILMSAFATARDHQRAIELGAVQVLCKPFTSMELTLAIQQAVECETGFRGSLHGISLIDVLQMFHYARRSVRVTVGGRVGGEIHIRDGEIVHALQGELVGEEALRRILAMPSGSIRSGPLGDTNQRTIERSFQGLVLDLLRELDEAGGDAFRDFDGALAPAAAAISASLRPRSQNAAAMCAELVTRVEGALRCGAVDIETGLVLANYAAEEADADDSDGLLIEAVELLRGANLARIDEMVGPGEKRPPGATAFREARILSDDAWRLILTTRGGKRAIVLVTRRDANPGLAFWHLKGSLEAFEPEP